MATERTGERRGAILNAVITTLSRTGYERLTMDAVASCAHASKATLYRNWSGKADLVEDALQSRPPCDQVVPDTGSVRGDLLAGLSQMVDEIRDRDLSLARALLTAVHGEPDLGAWLRGHLVDERCDAARAWVAREVDRGRLPADTDAELLSDVALPMVLMRLLVPGQPLDRPFLERVVDDVVLPLLLRTTEVPGDHGHDREHPAHDRPRVGQSTRA